MPLSPNNAKPTLMAPLPPSPVLGPSVVRGSPTYHAAPSTISLTPSDAAHPPSSPTNNNNNGKFTTPHHTFNVPSHSNVNTNSKNIHNNTIVHVMAAMTTPRDTSTLLGDSQLAANSVTTNSSRAANTTTNNFHHRSRRDSASTSRATSRSHRSHGGGGGVGSRSGRGGAKRIAPIGDVAIAGGHHGGEGEDDDELDVPGHLKRRPKPFCVRIPLYCSLLQQVLIIVSVFVVLIVVVSIETSRETKRLIEDRLYSNLHYSRSNILAPIENADKLLRSHRLRYMAESEANGASLCADDNRFSESTAFLRDALSSAVSYSPDFEWIYVVHASDTRTLNASTDVRAIYECGASASGVFSHSHDMTRYSQGSVSPYDLRTDDSTAAIPSRLAFEDSSSYRFQQYVTRALSTFHLTWVPYLSDLDADESTPSTLVFGAYAPMYMNVTLPDGTVTGLRADADDESRNVDGTIVASIALDLNFKRISYVMALVLPPVSGATVALYDMVTGTLLATTVAGFELVQDDGTLWLAGETPSAALNSAFNAIDPMNNFVGAVGADGRPNLRLDDDGDTYHTAVHVTSPELFPSGLSLVLIMTAPSAYYRESIVFLRSLMIGLGCACSFIIVASCAALAYTVRSNVRDIMEGMVLAGALKNDKVVYSRAPVLELDDLCEAFHTMNVKLGAARAFMPQSMLTSDSNEEQNTNDDEEEEGAGGGGDSATNTTTQHGAATSAIRYYDDEDDGNTHPVTMESASSTDHSKATTGSAHNRGAKTITAAAAGGGGGKSSNATPAANQRNAQRNGVDRDQQQKPSLGQPAGGLQLKRITVLAINGRGFHARGMSGGSAALVAIAANLTANVQATVAQYRGVIDSFHGDHFVLAFNTAKHNAQGPLKAVQCAMDIQQSAANILMMAAQQQQISGGKQSTMNMMMNDGRPSAPTAAVVSGPAQLFSMGISVGKGLSGHLGSRDMKRNSIVAKSYSRALTLERLCKLLGDEGDVAAAVAAAATKAFPTSVEAAMEALVAAVSKAQQIDVVDNAPTANDSSSSIGILIDASVLPDIEHAYCTQVMGKLCDSASAFTHLAASTAADPAAAMNMLSAEAGVGGGGSRSSNGASSSSYGSAETLFYAVRGVSVDDNKRNDGDRGDEWLYELKGALRRTAADDDGLLPSVNQAFTELLGAFHLIAGGGGRFMANNTTAAPMSVSAHASVSATQRLSALRQFAARITQLRGAMSPDDAAAQIGYEWGVAALGRAEELISAIFGCSAAAVALPAEDGASGGAFSMPKNAHSQSAGADPAATSLPLIIAQLRLLYAC